MKTSSYRLPLDSELGYVAGLVDGEGWIGIHRRKRTWKTTTPRYYLRPALVIGMSRREPLDYVANVLGLHLEEMPNYEGDLYRLRLHASALRHFLPILIPRLILKRRQAEIVLEFLTRCRYMGKELTVEELLKRENLAAEIRLLNERPASIRRRLGAQVS